MKNQEIARIFYDFADILELKDVEWKPKSYRRAAVALENLSEDIEDVVKKGIKAVEEIPGVGKGIAEKIIEYCQTGHIKKYEEFQKGLPKKIELLFEVPGLGPKRIKKLFKDLNVSSIKQLESAALKHKISDLPGFGEKSEQDILRGINFLKKNAGRMLLGHILPIAESIKKQLEQVIGVEKVEIAGSIRRMKDTIGDIDVLASSKNPSKIVDFFCAMSFVKEVLAKGNTKASVILNSGIQADLRVIEPNCFGAALQYFTGNKEHNIVLRKIAINKGYKLSEYGLFDRVSGKFIVGETEPEIYNKLGIQIMPPEMRENMGEIELGLKHNIPKLVEFKDIKGDLHIHTTWSDGWNSVLEMGMNAKKLGYEYICITDHSRSQKIANGLDIDRLLNQIKEIKKIKIPGIKVLCGSEVDVKSDGSLDYPDEVLKKLNIVIGSFHSGFNATKSEVMQRYRNLMENKYLDIVGHPSGRLYPERKGFDVDFDELIELARVNKKVLEVDSQPERLDLDYLNIKKAVSAGVKISIDSDSHNVHQMSNVKLGVATARRGWAKKKDVVNTFSFDELNNFFKKI